LSFFLLFTTVDIIISSFAIVITFLAVVVAVMIVIAVVVAAVAVVAAIAVIVAAIVLLLPLLPFFVVATIAVVAVVSVIAVMSVVEKLIWAMQETKALVVSDRSFQHDASGAFLGSGRARPRYAGNGSRSDPGDTISHSAFHIELVGIYGIYTQSIICARGTVLPST